ncbi:MAG: hypothetical protein ABI330_20820 [Caldimonas sp.]
MQLDIFDHSRDVMLRNDVVDALERREASLASAAWRAFANEFPHDDTLSALAVLIEALEGSTVAVFAAHDALRDARRTLDHDIEPAARRVFGERAGTMWVAAVCRVMALRAARLPFRGDRDEDHAVPLWLRAGDWQAAADAVGRIESWRRIPASLAWMAEARYRLEGLEPIWALLAEFAWLAPARYGELTRRLADPSLDKLRKQFDAGFEGDGDVADLAWFPAWVLTEKPGVARWLGQAQPSRDGAPERAMRLLLELIGLERQGRHRDVVDRRKVLRDTHPVLYGAYLRTR